MSVLVGKSAPSFSASAVVDGQIVENFSLDQYKGSKYVVFFFYPKDFTFVCPTELHAFQDNLAAFEERDVAVVGCSTDTEMSHWGWTQVPRALRGWTVHERFRGRRVRGVPAVPDAILPAGAEM